MELSIRKAAPRDAEAAVPLIIEAIGDIAKRLTGESDWKKIQDVLCELFVREDNRHSYKYTYIVETDGEVAGIIVLYNGDVAQQLDHNIVKFLEERGTNYIEIDQEALPGELYIDTVCIDRKYRGQGIGSKLFKFVEKVAVEEGYQKLSLNVEIGKEDAIRLYKRLGYEIAGPWTIIGEPFHHMVKEI